MWNSVRKLTNNEMYHTDCISLIRKASYPVKEGNQVGELCAWDFFFLNQAIWVTTPAILDKFFRNNKYAVFL